MTMPANAVVSSWIAEKWNLLSAEQQQAFSMVLAAWIDQTRVDAQKFYARMSVVANAQEAQAALDAYTLSANETADSGQLDLLTICGEHIPAAADARRQQLFIACLPTKHQTKQ
jgi:hypothetical protein